MTTWIRCLVLVVVLFSANLALADKEWPEFRLFGSFTDLRAEPTVLNADLRTNQIEEVKGILGWGAEVTMRPLSFLKFGIRGGQKVGDFSQPSEGAATPNTFSVKQNYAGFITRLNLINTKPLRFELFAEGGLTQAEFEYQTQTQKSKYTSENGTYARTGMSAAIGWDKYYLFAEWGPEWNKATKIVKAGDYPFNMTTFDFSGNYFIIGIFLDGVPGVGKTSSR